MARQVITKHTVYRGRRTNRRGVIRYPNATTYTAGMSPYWGNSCCNSGCNI